MDAPELRHMRSILEIAQQRSFTRAAERMHVAQQALSQQVRAVEEQLGVRLFDRGNRGVVLTAAGTVFVQEARRVLAAADRLTALTQAAAIGELGVLRLAYTLSATYEVLPAVVTAARSISPAIRVEQREVVASDMEQALLDGRQDAGVCPQMPLSPGIGRMELGREPLVLAVSEQHELAGQKSVPLAAVADERFSLWPREVSPGYHDTVITACRSAGFQPRLGEPATGAAVWSTIADGDGVGLVVRSMAVQLPRGVSLVPLDPPAPTLGFDLLWALDSDLPLIDRLRAALR